MRVYAPHTAMAKRPSQRLRFGAEMVPPGPLLMAQVQFLEAVRKCVPSALSDLAERTAQLVSTTFSDGVEAKAPPELRNHPFNRAIIARRPRWQHDSSDLKSVVREWCKQWHFTITGKDDGVWLLDVVRNTAKRMYRQQLNGDPADLQWEYPTASYPKPKPVALSPPTPDRPWLETTWLAPPDYQPWRETREQYLQRVDTYTAKVEAASGWTTPPEKRAMVHFDWLARFQVAGLSCPAIANSSKDSKGLDEDLVAKGVKATAALVGLQRRATPRGRPSKKEK